MSTVKLVKWGNSWGIRIPAPELKLINAYPGEEFTIKPTKEGGLTLVPTQQPDNAWLNAFNAIADAKEDEMILDDLPTDFDKDEWQW